MEYLKVLYRCPSCGKKNFPEIRRESLLFTCPSCCAAEMEQFEIPEQVPLEQPGHWRRTLPGMCIGYMVCRLTGLGGWLPYTILPVAACGLIYLVFPIKKRKVVGIESVKTKAGK